MEAYYKVEKSQDYYVEHISPETERILLTVSSDTPPDFLPPAF